MDTAALLATRFTIKPPEWKASDWREMTAFGHVVLRVWVMDTPIGIYRVCKDGATWSMYRTSSKAKRRAPRTGFFTADEAKAEAEKHYYAKVESLLVPADAE
jgi:hypothetical protein